MKSKSCSVKSAKHTKYENQAATGPAEAFFVPLGDGPGPLQPDGARGAVGRSAQSRLVRCGELVCARQAAVTDSPPAVPWSAAGRPR
jgi:hypothetical protein